MKDRVEAIVISEDHYNALGVVRSLGIVGIRTHLLLTAGTRTYVDASKYVFDARRIERTETAILSNIKEIAVYSRLRYPLFPLSDFAAQVLDNHVAEFNSNIVVPHMNGKMFGYSNKLQMKVWAQQNGLGVPEGKIIELPGLLLEWNIFPVIVKPLLSVEGTKGDIALAESLEELNGILNAFASKNYKRVLAERYIKGRDQHMVEVLGERTEKGCRFAGIIRKIREFPIENGSTSYAEIVSEHPGVHLEQIANMMDQIQYQGLFDMEFKYAEHNLYFIECNFRNGAPGWAFTKKGINLPVMWIADSIGENYQSIRAMTQKNRFMCEQNDVINMLKGCRALVPWMKDFIFSYKIFWDIHDINPVVKYYRQFITSQIIRFIKRRS